MPVTPSSPNSLRRQSLSEGLTRSDLSDTQDTEAFSLASQAPPTAQSASVNNLSRRALSPSTLHRSMASYNYIAQKAAPRTVNSTEEVTESSLVPPLKAKGEHLDLSELIHPSSLQGKIIGKDYVFLVHNPGEGAAVAIRSGGLKSLAQLALEPNASESVKSRFNSRSKRENFGNDPNIVYFRPVAPGSTHKIHEHSIIVAAHPNSVNVFDQEYRADTGTKTFAQNYNMYKSSSLNVSQYLERQSNLPRGSFLNQHGYPMNYSQIRNVRQYIPECAINTGFISQDMFIDYQDVDKSMKET